MSMIPSATVHWEPEHVAARLHRLDLSERTLRRAVWLAFGEHLLQTDHDADWYRGGVLPAKATRHLRDALVPTGWKAEKDHGLELVVHGANRHGLIVWSGDANTGGLPPRMPSTRHPRGEASRIVINENLQGVLLLDDGSPATRGHRNGSQRPIWALLLRAEASRVLAEVSLPSAVSFDGRVETWHERIILGVIDGLTDQATAAKPSITPKAPFQVVPVAR